MPGTSSGLGRLPVTSEQCCLVTAVLEADEAVLSLGDASSPWHFYSSSSAQIRASPRVAVAIVHHNYL